jgi:hypothetical protein
LKQAQTHIRLQEQVLERELFAYGAPRAVARNRKVNGRELSFNSLLNGGELFFVDFLRNGATMIKVIEPSHT